MENKNLKAKVVLIEDDADMMDLITSFFKNLGCQVFSYDDAAVAYRELKANVVSCDLIVTDLFMKEMDGIEFTKKMKKINSPVPIILVTGNKKVETAVEAIDAGAYDFVVKPIHFPQFRVSVERALFMSRLRKQNNNLRATLKAKDEINSGIIGKSEKFLKVIDLVQRVAPTEANVFIHGETGVGKEVIAKSIHLNGNRRNAAFIPLNCSSIPENLLESELFGHAKGAFTGAAEGKIGLFEEANGGTLFLDEIGDLSLPLQAKLLRVIQERKIKRLGENRFRNIDVRLLSATHKNLKLEISEKRFREDLFYRLNVIQIQIPPLRERKDDIYPLAEFFLERFSVRNNPGLKGFHKSAWEKMLGYRWPGNIRELENTIERSVILCRSDIMTAEDLLIDSSDFVSNDLSEVENFAASEFGNIMTLEEVTQKYIYHVLKINKGAKEKTAKDLGIDRKTLYRKISETTMSH